MVVRKQILQNLMQQKATLLAAVLVTFTGCLDSEDESLINDAFTPYANYSHIDEPAPEAGCFNDRFYQPAPEGTNKLDLLFVADTSGSINAERGDIANGIDSFIAALPADVDLRVGVMLAHGNTSGHAGSLFQQAAEPHVLDSSSMTIDEIRTALHDKMVNPATDNATDGGEVGLYSLSRSLDADKLTEAQAHGLYRDDAALAIVFIADENDICADFPAGITPVPDGQNIEPGAKVSNCGGITPQSVVDKVKAQAGDNPVTVAGIIYNNTATVPAGGENEYGYGYVETIGLMSGLTVDLADGNYDAGLTQIGQLATLKFTAQTEFQPIQPDVNPGSVEVWVNGQLQPHNYVSETNTVHILGDPGPAWAAVDISYCEMPAGPTGVDTMCTAGSFVPKASINVGLSTDMTSGESAFPTNGLTSIGVPYTNYSDADIAAGQPELDGTTVMIVSRKVVLSSVDQNYIDGILSFMASGGSVIGEFDGAAMMFNSFVPGLSIISNLDPTFALFDGQISGGGVLLPFTDSTTVVSDASHPLMQGMPSSFYSGPKRAFALSGFNGEWLHTSAEFISTDFAEQVPLGTYSAVLSGRCGGGRLVLMNMNYFNTLGADSSTDTLVNNALNWSTGN